MFTGWRCPMRLEEQDIRVMDPCQQLERQRVRPPQAKPVANRHHIIAGQVLRCILYTEKIRLVCLPGNRLCNLLRIPRHRGINHCPFTQINQPPRKFCLSYCCYCNIAP